ncbi:hypothetical protein ES707_05325 [subsurface metagenome]
MKKILTLFIALILVAGIVSVAKSADIDSAASNYATSEPKDRHIVKTSDGKIVVLYSKGGDIVAKKSTNNGDSWTGLAGEGGATTIDDTYEHDFSICLDASTSNIYVAYEQGYDIYFRRLTYNAPNWEVGTEKEVQGNDSSDYPSIVRESGGRIWVAYSSDDDVTDSGVYANYSDNEGDTWEWTDIFEDTSGESHMYYQPALVIRGSYPFVVYNDKVIDYNMKAERWNGSSWLDAGVVTSDSSEESGFSVTTIGSDVHVVYQEYMGGICHRFYDGSWHAGGTLSSDTNDEDVSLTTDGTDLWCFISSYTSTNHYYIGYKKRSGSTWDSTWTGISDNAKNLHTTTPSKFTSYIPIAWTVGTDPYPVKYDLLDFTPPPAPVIESTSHPTEGTWYDDDHPYFNWTCDDTSGITGYSYEWDHSPTTTPDTTSEGPGTSEDYPDQDDGTWYFHVRARNGSNLWGEADHYQVNIDATAPGAPTITSSSHPTEGTWYSNNDPSFDWSGLSDTSGITGYSYEWDHSPTTTPDTTSEGPETSEDYPDQDDGTWYFHVRARNGSNLWGAADHYLVNIDATAPGAPTITSSSHPTEGTWYSNNDPSFDWSGLSDTSGITGYSYEWDHSPTTTPDTTSEGPETSEDYPDQDDGTWYFHVRARNGSNLWGAADHYLVKIDVTPPTTPGTPSTPTPTSDTTPTWDWTASEDTHSGLRVTNTYIIYWDTVAEGTANFAYTSTNSYTHTVELDEGTWYAKVRAYDAVDNPSNFSENGSVLIEPSSKTYTWDEGGAAGSWTDENNWDLNDGYPDDKNDKAIIDLGSESINTGAVLTIGELELGSSYSGTLTLGGNLTLDDSGGRNADLTISAGTTLDLAGKNLTLESGSTFSNSGTLKLQGDETVSKAPTNGSGSTVEYTATDSRAIKNWTYYHLKINGSGGTFTVGTGETLGGDLTIAAGIFNLNGQIVNVTGNFLKSGGTLYMHSTNDELDIAGNFTVEGGAADITSSGADIYIGGNIDISGDDSFVPSSGRYYMDHAGNANISITGDNNDLGYGSPYTAYFYVRKTNSTDTVTLLTDMASNHFFHEEGVFDVNGSSASFSGLYYGWGGSELQMSSGTFRCGRNGYVPGTFSPWYCQNLWTENISGGTITVYGGKHATYGTAHFANGSNFTPTGGTFQLVGTDAASIYIAEEHDADFNFYNLTIGDGTNTKTVEMDASSYPLDVDANFTVKTNATFDTSGKAVDVASNVDIDGTFNASTSIITVAGSWDSSAGTFNYDTSTVDLTGTGNLKTRYTGSAYGLVFYNLKVAAAGKTTTMLGSHVGVEDTLTIGDGILTDPINTYYLSLLKNSGTPLNLGNATITISRIVYRPSNGTVTVTGGNYGTLNLLLFPTASGATFNLDDSSVTVNGTFWLFAPPGINNVVCDTNDNGITATRLYFGGGSANDGSTTLNCRTSTIDIGIDGLYVLSNGGSHTLNLSSATVTCAGKWDLSEGSGSIAQIPGTSTVTFDSDATPTNITSNSQSFASVVFDSENGTGEWTLQDNFTCSSLQMVDKKLTDGGKIVTVNGNIIIANATTQILNSTGLWIQGANGNISNPSPNYRNNQFRILQIDDGVTSIRTSTVRTRKLVLGTSAILQGNSSVGVDTPLVNDFIDMGSGSSITGGAISILPATGSRTQKAINTSVNVSITWIASATIQMTGDWTIGDLTIFGAASAQSEETAAVLDTNGNNLTVNGSLTLGRDTGTGYHGKIIFSTGTHSITDNVVINNNNANTHGYFDLGSADVSIGGNCNFSYATVTPGTSTVTLNGSGAQTVTSDSESFHHLEINNTGTSVQLEDELDVDGDLTISIGTLDTKSGENNPINIAGNWTFAGGTFECRQSTVTFDNASSTSTLTGSTTFYVLVSTTTGKSVKVSSDTVINVTNHLNFENITLRSTLDNATWYLDLSGTQDVSNVDVRDSNASGGDTILDFDCPDIEACYYGNNTNWDFGPPAAITDLTGECDSGTGDVTLYWSTPGDDKWTGTLVNVPNESKYIIDYSTYSIAWSTSTYEVEIPTHSVAPHTEVSHTITGLTGGTTWYFRIWTADEIPLWSGLSNGATVWVSVIVASVTVSAHTSGYPDVPPTYVYTQSTGNCLGTFKFDGVGTITQLTITGYGNCDADGELENVKLFRDDNGNGNWESGEDTTLLGSTTDFNSIDKATFSEFSLVASTDTSCYVHVVLDVKSNADDGDTVGIELYQNDIVCTSTTTATSWPVQLGTSTIKDATAPAAITDLTGLCDSGSGNVKLSWSTPGDDGWIGALVNGSKYRIDYSSYSIAWSTMTFDLDISTHSVAPHTQVSHTITDLTSNTTYYFRIWTADEVSNWSGLSNGATVWTYRIAVWDGGGGNNDWSTGANWTGDIVPRVTDDVVFNNTSNKPCTIDISTTVASFSIQTGSTITITAEGNLTVTGDISLSTGTFNAGSTLLTVGGDWSVAGDALFNCETSTVTFNSNDIGNTITSGGSSLASVVFDSGDGTGGWTLQDDLFCTNISLSSGSLYDTNQTVTVNGNIYIANVDNLLFSGGTGLWIQGANGNISNPYWWDNKFKVLKIDDDVISTRTGSVLTKKLILGTNATLGGGSSVSLVFPTVNDFIDMGSGSDVIGGAISITPHWTPGTKTQKAINVSAPVYIGNISSATIKMTGNWTTGNLTIHGAGSSTTETAAAVLDTNGNDLTVINGNLTLGWSSSGHYGKIIFSSGTHTVIGNVGVANNANTHGYFDLGSADISIAGNCDFSRATVTPGTSTVTLNGSGAQTVTSDSESFHHLEINNTGTSVQLEDDLDVDGDLTISIGTLDTKSGENNPINIAGNWTFAGGTFECRQSTVTFDNASSTSTLTGSTTFYVLVSTTTGKSVKVSSDTVINVTNHLNFENITLRSTLDNATWYLDLSGDQDVSGVDVRDSNASGGDTIIDFDCPYIESCYYGNNTNWDFAPPAAITDLTGLCDSGTGDVTLSWSTPGDDEWTGVLSSTSEYRIDYSTDSSRQWDKDTYEVSIPTYGVTPYTEVSHTITGLTGDSTWYFRIWTADEIPRWSGLSNGATVWVNPILSVSISTNAYDFGDVPMGQSTHTVSVITVTNDGNVNETYSLKISSVTLYDNSPSLWKSTNTTTGHNRFIFYAIFHAVQVSTSNFDSDDYVIDENRASTADWFSDNDGGGNKQTGINVPKGDDRKLWFRLDMPTSTTTGKEEKITVTITAGPE